MAAERNARILGTIPFLITVCLLALPAQAQYSGGTGEPNDPYRIATAADLIALGETPGDYGKHFVLVADIDLDPNLPGRKVFDKAVIAPDTRRDPNSWRRFEGVPFTGVFDGDSHTISHLTIKGKNCLGLMGSMWPEAVVSDLNLEGVDISGTGWCVGALVGGVQSWWPNECRIAAVYSTGTVIGTWAVGGLVGASNGGRMTHCYSSCSVSGQSNIGGLVGSNGADITASYSSGMVCGNREVGGLAGDNCSMEEATSFSGTAANCYSTSPVTGAFRIGGLVGNNEFGTVANCYSAGAVSGGEEVGGLVGTNQGDLYWEEGLVKGCFWDTQTSGQTWSAGGEGRTTAEMQTAMTFLDAAWDFRGETAFGMEDIWSIVEGKDYPRLIWQHLASFAFCPYPQDGAVDVLRGSILSWRTATSARTHDVYLGDDTEAVAGATNETLALYRGRSPVEANAYDPGLLDGGKTYYWRIDEVNGADPNSAWKGSVWSFTTADFNVVTVIDDFESYADDIKSYTDDSDLIWKTWIDGSCYGDPNNPAGDANHSAYYPGNGTGSFVGNSEPPFAEQQIVRSGRQSMPMDYNNLREPWYSEADRTWETPQDWTIDGADTLTLYFRGKPNNSPEPLYVGIEDSGGRMAVVVHPDADAVLATEWQKWHIALADVRAAGVDVAAVQKMVIGVGDRKNPKPGGTGRMYIDDIRLTKRMP